MMMVVEIICTSSTPQLLMWYIPIPNKFVSIVAKKVLFVAASMYEDTVNHLKLTLIKQFNLYLLICS